MGPNPLVRGRSSARILVVGQAPGRVAHRTSTPWNDKSGERLREWMGLSEAQFYDESLVAIVPMGFCYPGTGKGGDLPPRTECAETWHEKINRALKHIELRVYAGRYAIEHNCEDVYPSVTAAVREYERYMPDRFFLPHPSPRNNLWLRRNAWFEGDVVPMLQKRVAGILRDYS